MTFKFDDKITFCNICLLIFEFVCVCVELFDELDMAVIVVEKDANELRSKRLESNWSLMDENISSWFAFLNLIYIILIKYIYIFYNTYNVSVLIDRFDIFS